MTTIEFSLSYVIVRCICVIKFFYIYIPKNCMYNYMV